MKNLTPILVCLASLALTACATDDQLGPTRTFATAASAFATNSTSALQQVNDSSIERNIAKVAAGDGTVSSDTFIGVTDNDKSAALCLQALSDLGKYADALNALANAGYGADIDKAATSLYGSLSSIKTDATKIAPSAANISSNDLGIFATVVDGIGRVVAYEKQEAAIKQAVRTADPGVQALCAQLPTLFNGLAPYYAANLKTYNTEMMVAFNADKTHLSFDDRLARLHELEPKVQAWNTAAEFLQKLAQSATALGSAHAKLLASFNNSSVNFNDLVSTVGQLKSLADDLKTFNSNLSKGSN